MVALEMESLTVLLTLIFLLTSHLPSSMADDITDRDGDAIRNGGTYHILPLFGVKGGGIEAARTGNETCALTVVQSRTANLFGGLPIKISSPYRMAYISEGFILNLEFPSSSSCGHDSATWTVVKDLPEGLAVKLPGYGSTVSGWFEIEKSRELEYLYKVVFCARGSNSCGSVGISVDDEGNSRLVVTDDDDDAILVEFTKAT